jgi:beta-glucosidase/6-phospho-beta-glucosidase/beta-galactosidase
MGMVHAGGRPEVEAEYALLDEMGVEWPPLIASEEERALFREYVEKTVEHYKDRVDAWCIWNEPNLQPRFWVSEGTKEQIFDLTKAAAAHRPLRHRSR